MNKREAKEYVREQYKIIGRRYDRPYVWVSLCIIFKGQPLARTGVARCSEDDKWDIKMGEKIARGRAVAKLADDLVAQTVPVFGDLSAYTVPDWSMVVTDAQNVK